MFTATKPLAVSITTNDGHHITGRIVGEDDGGFTLAAFSLIDPDAVHVFVCRDEIASVHVHGNL